MEAAEARLPRSKLQAAQGFSLTYDNAPVSLHPASASSSAAASLPRLLHIGAKYGGRMFRAVGEEQVHVSVHSVPHMCKYSVLP